jgi:magnesium transporter
VCLSPKGNVQSTQEIVELILDSNRNALLALDLKVKEIALLPTLLLNTNSPTSTLFVGLHWYYGNWNWGPDCRVVWHECALQSLLFCTSVPAFSSTSPQLTSHMEEHPYAFTGMSVASTVIALLVAWAGLRRSVFPTLPDRTFTSADSMFRLAKIQKVGLSASNGRKRAGGLPLSVRQRRPEIWP